MPEVLAVILGGGRGARLFPLTRYRAKPAVPIGGKFRLIDIPISNCLHWDIKKIMVLTQFNTASLHRHITQTYRFDSFSEGFLQILAAQQTIGELRLVPGHGRRRAQEHPATSRTSGSDYVVILSGDQLYRINLREFLQRHRERKADISIAVKPITRARTHEFGIMQIDDQQQITRFVEKPAGKDAAGRAVYPG